jgi:hypothetical protein
MVSQLLHTNSYHPACHGSYSHTRDEEARGNLKGAQTEKQAEIRKPSSYLPAPRKWRSPLYKIAFAFSLQKRHNFLQQVSGEKVGQVI